MRVSPALVAFLVSALSLHHAAWAQCPPTWVPGIGTPGTNASLGTFAVLPGGDVIVGGGFSTAGGVAANYIARYNPTTGLWSALGAGTSGQVNALAVLPGGDVIVGGAFNTAGGVTGRNCIARVNPTTSAWSAVGAGTVSTVRALAVRPGGEVIVGGDFATIGGVLAYRIARYNPTTGVWSALGAGITGPNTTVYGLAVVPGGDVIAGGFFLTAGGVPANFIARYTFGAPAPTITTHPSQQSTCRAGSAAFSVTPAGSDLFTYQWRKNTIAIDTVTNPSAATATLTLINVGPADAASYDCIVTNACGSVTSNVATLTICSADFNCDASVDFFDYLDFVAAFSSSQSIADFNHDGEVDFFDYLDFVSEFSGGC